MNVDSTLEHHTISGFFELRYPKSIRRCLTAEATLGLLIQVIISLYAGWTTVILCLQRLHSVWNEAARLISVVRRLDHFIPFLKICIDYWFERGSRSRGRCNRLEMPPLCSLVTCRYLVDLYVALTIHDHWCLSFTKC